MGQLAHHGLHLDGTINIMSDADLDLPVTQGAGWLGHRNLIVVQINATGTMDKLLDLAFNVGFAGCKRGWVANVNIA